MKKIFNSVPVNVKDGCAEIEILTIILIFLA